MFDKKDCSINIKFVNFLYEKLVISSRFCLKFSLIPTTLLILIPVLIAVLKHTFPSRTRLLRGPAAMILHIWVWESSSTPDFFFALMLHNPWVWPEEKHNSPWNTGAYGCRKNAEMPVEWWFFLENFLIFRIMACSARCPNRPDWLDRSNCLSKVRGKFWPVVSSLYSLRLFFPSALACTSLVLWRMEVPPEKNGAGKPHSPCRSMTCTSRKLLIAISCLHGDHQCPGGTVKKWVQGNAEISVEWRFFLKNFQTLRVITLQFCISVSVDDYEKAVVFLIKIQRLFYV